MSDRFLKLLLVLCFAVGALIILSAVVTAEYLVVMDTLHSPQTLSPKLP